MVRLALLAATFCIAITAGAQAATSVSSNWAGYAATGKRFKSVSGSWAIPAGACTQGNPGYESTWVGLGGYSETSQALEQIGTEFDCTARGTAEYSAWYELVPDVSHTIAMTVSPGDRIDASVTVAGRKVTLILRNRTHAATFRRVLTMRSTAPDLSSAEWIVEAPADCNESGQCVQLPISNFGTQQFERAYATTSSGHKAPVSSFAPTTIVLDQANRHDRFADAATAGGASPSALSAGGTSFSVAYTDQPTPSTNAPPFGPPGSGD